MSQMAQMVMWVIVFLILATAAFYVWMHALHPDPIGWDEHAPDHDDEMQAKIDKIIAERYGHRLVENEID